MEPPSVSALGNKNSSHLKALLTSPSAVPHAVEPKKHKVLAVETTVPDTSIKCFRLFDTPVNGVYKELKGYSEMASMHKISDKGIVAISEGMVIGLDWWDGK